jgi:hypothetical protein
MSRNPHEPTADSRKSVKGMAALGLPQPLIAAVQEIDDKTLRKYYGDELKQGKAGTNLQVAGWLFEQCKKGNVTAMIFWLKTQAGWKETTRVEIADDEHAAEVAAARAKVMRFLSGVAVQQAALEDESTPPGQE